MKQYVTGMLLLSVLTTASAGDMGPQQSSSPCCRWTIGGELSYLRPDGAMIDYATEMVFVTPTVVAAHGSYVNPSYEPSWSAFVKYNWTPQADIQFRTTHFDHEFGSSVTIPDSLLVVNSTLVSDFFGGAAGKVLFDLDNYELSIGANINASQSGWRLRPYTGLHYVEENDRLIQRFYRSDAAFVHYLTSRFRGIGPIIGLESHYPLFDRLTLKNDFTLGFLIGDADMRTMGDINDAPIQPITYIDFKNFDRERLVPYGFLDIGLQYDLPLGAYEAGINGGFKVIYYDDIHGRRAGTGPNDPLRLNYVTYYGPYIGVQIRA
ncbi:hypothetical protein Lqui_1234 [Legionella quinlivanii]|uniref:Major outer membrane protein n=1 Tax=Legionella quinlivanii TaxID=45073 RepID=A0A0W0Y127_9GAMM|nr:Lpg1974 family pore-forming outer membrane protein [Legionella quinlivanii]KTD50668.1 hypothetical protein Lqui_1234 [Legionella quinlivanii]MCW8450241.1 Lpg1974 family pore-forming outer membrane protein [Legionella quinlivanii]SEG35895.1 hypothetical protein SAMN02746093_02649 [Legionella quinlivanii DSM 21216]STY11609.1 Uncharacterised protein [Legionella quinlivanii]